MKFDMCAVLGLLILVSLPNAFCQNDGQNDQFYNPSFVHKAVPVAIYSDGSQGEQIPHYINALLALNGENFRNNVNFEPIRQEGQNYLTNEVERHQESLIPQHNQFAQQHFSNQVSGSAPSEDENFRGNGGFLRAFQELPQNNFINVDTTENEKLYVNPQNQHNFINEVQDASSNVGSSNSQIRNEQRGNSYNELQTVPGSYLDEPRPVRTEATYVNPQNQHNFINEVQDASSNIGSSNSQIRNEQRGNSYNELQTVPDEPRPVRTEVTPHYKTGEYEVFVDKPADGYFLQKRQHEASVQDTSKKESDTRKEIVSLPNTSLLQRLQSALGSGQLPLAESQSLRQSGGRINTPVQSLSPPLNGGFRRQKKEIAYINRSKSENSVSVGDGFVPSFFGKLLVPKEKVLPQGRSLNGGDFDLGGGTFVPGKLHGGFIPSENLFKF